MYLRLNIRGPSCHQKTVASLCPVRPENSNLDEGCSLLVGVGVAVDHCSRVPVHPLFHDHERLSLFWFECRVRLALNTLSLSRFAYLVVYSFN